MCCGTPDVCVCGLLPAQGAPSEMVRQGSLMHAAGVYCHAVVQAIASKSCAWMLFSVITGKAGTLTGL